MRPNNNRKLTKDLQKLVRECPDARARYVFFAAPGFKHERQRNLEAVPDIEVWQSTSKLALLTSTTARKFRIPAKEHILIPRVPWRNPKVIAITTERHIRMRRGTFIAISAE